LSLAKQLKRPSAADAKNAPKGYEVKVTLVSCSPLFNVDKPDTDDTPIEDNGQAATEATTEATTFTAEAHVSHIMPRASKRGATVKQHCSSRRDTICLIEEIINN
jgi:hypothetical protein